MNTHARFYADRDRRTAAYGLATDILEKPVGVAIGEQAASSMPGQVLLLAVVNMVARIHRRVQLDIPDVPLLVPTLVPAPSLGAAAYLLAQAINPFISLGIGPSGADIPVVAMGSRRGAVYAGADGFSAATDVDPVAITKHPGTILGAGLAACLASASLLNLVSGSRPPLRRVSLWALGELGDTEAGPAIPLEPLNIGDRVVLVGAGAVGSALAYWLQLVGIRGHWLVVDADRAELHNTNRCLSLLAVDSGWSINGPVAKPAYKADVVARMIGGVPKAVWYHEWVATEPDRPDFLIPVANEYGVRQMVGHLGLPLMVHASTSPNWTAELHRHGPGDDCPACRFPQSTTPAFKCSEGPLALGLDIAPTLNASDAALPFLSAAAGLLLLAGLIQLAGEYITSRTNHHRLLFQPGIDYSWLNSVKQCRAGCMARPSPAARRRLNAGHRWAFLDEI